MRRIRAIIRYLDPLGHKQLLALDIHWPTDLVFRGFWIQKTSTKTVLEP